MLRGSFSLVLSEDRIDFLDNIAKTAFIEITSHDLFTPNSTSNPLSTAFLSTDTAKTLNERPGIYVIKSVENGMCIVGQTLNLRKRLNQYTIRTKETSSESQKINQHLRFAVQQAAQNGIQYNQAFQRYAVYTWVGDDKKALEINFTLQNEMNYLEHRLILAFFECKLCYNINDVAPQLNLATINSLPSPPLTVESTQTSTSEPALIKSAYVAKPFKVNSLYFYSKPQYTKYRDSLSADERKRFKAVPSLRLELERNKNNLNATTRYLSSEEIQEGETKGYFNRT